VDDSHLASSTDDRQLRGFFAHTPREFVLLDDGIRRWGVWSRRMILFFCRVSGSFFPCVVNRRLGSSERSNVPCHLVIEDFGPFAGETILACFSVFVCCG
jgi:hypothetical protein